MAQKISAEAKRPRIEVYVSDHLWRATELKYNTKEEMGTALAAVINRPQRNNHYPIRQDQDLTPLNVTVRVVGPFSLKHGKAFVMANIPIRPMTEGGRVFSQDQFNYDLTDPLSSFDKKPFPQDVFTIGVTTLDASTVLVLQVNITGDNFDAYSAATTILFEKVPKKTQP
jgi:hypothetical protein